MREQQREFEWRVRGSRHVFIDESVRRDGLYRLTGVAVPTRDLASSVARAVRERTHHGASRVHFSAESDGRRREMLRSFGRLPIDAVVLVAPYPVRTSEQVARDLCLTGLVSLLDEGIASLVLDTRGPDRDRLDRIALRLAMATRSEIDVVYSHRGSRDEPLIALADAIGWAIGAGGRWGQLVAGFATTIVVSG